MLQHLRLFAGPMALLVSLVGLRAKAMGEYDVVAEADHFVLLSPEGVHVLLLDEKRTFFKLYGRLFHSGKLLGVIGHRGLEPMVISSGMSERRLLSWLRVLITGHNLSQFGSTISNNTRAAHIGPDGRISSRLEVFGVPLVVDPRTGRIVSASIEPSDLESLETRISSGYMSTNRTVAVLEAFGRTHRQQFQFNQTSFRFPELSQFAQRVMQGTAVGLSESPYEDWETLSAVEHRGGQVIPLQGWKAPG